MGVVFITGASSGLGEALARVLAHEGHSLALAARRVDALERVAGEVQAAGGHAVPIRCDVASRDDVFDAVARTREALGAIDVFVANAGIAPDVRAKRFASEPVHETFQVNLFGVVYGIEAVLPEMLERGQGHIVGVSSIAAFQGLPGGIAYGASKAALTNLLEGLRLELKPTGVAVTTIHPGFVKTPMTEKHRFKMPFLMEVDDAARHIARAIRRRAPVCTFPWQLGAASGVGRLLPRHLFDKMVAKQGG